MPLIKNKGYVLLVVLGLVALSSVAALRVTQSIAVAAQREKEALLLARGREIVQAIGEYFEKTPGGVRIYPPTLDALLQDERFLGLERHLRALRTDPMQPDKPWGLIRASDGGIAGVYSQSSRVPIAKAGFTEFEIGFGSAVTYGDWRFEYVPRRSTPLLTPTSPQLRNNSKVPAGAADLRSK